MAIYIFSQLEDYTYAGLDYALTYKQRLLETTSQEVKYVRMDTSDPKGIEAYKKIGIKSSQILGVCQCVADNIGLTLSVKVTDKLEELKNSLHYTTIEHRNNEIRLIRDAYVIATIALSEDNKNYCKGIYYFNYARLIRAEIYTNGIPYIEYFKTAKSENGLYAKLCRRTFYFRNGSVAFDQIFEGEKEWYLFPNGKRCTKSQVIVKFLEKLNLSEQDVILVDSFVPDVYMDAIFMFGKAAKIIGIVHAGINLKRREEVQDSFISGFPYYWFRYAEALDSMIVSTRAQKEILERELEKYHCNIPNVRVESIEGEFTYAVIHEAYNENLAFSWSFKGKVDGFWIYDESGKQICETRNEYKHYFLIRGYSKESGFTIKAFKDTSIGKVVIAETGFTYLQAPQYKETVISLVIPAYNAENYIARTLDNALAQSFNDLEIIVVDDGSTDFTPEILEWYAKKYSNVAVIHQENSGLPAAARNTGIEAAKGEYIAFMDNDDMIRPDMMERLYNSARKNECDIAMTSVHAITNQGYKIHLSYRMEEDIALTSDDFLNNYYIPGSGNSVVIWNKLYRTSLVKMHRFPVFAYDDEAWTPCILSYANKICYLNNYLYEYDRKIRDNTLVNEWWQQEKEKRFKLLKKATLFYLEQGNPEKRCVLKAVAKEWLGRFKRGFKDDEYERLWEQIDQTF